ncbi:MAG: hypothetical protein J3K34DRAFT_486286 [Monoraphidium minutum]|nr:MAG: hypothetical protein J3K34DRAFT_486286 [Monoraphidium minutum]
MMRPPSVGASGVVTAPAAAGATAWISQAGGACAGAPRGRCATFVAALTDARVTHIFLESDVTLRPADLDRFKINLYPLTRNLSIASAPGRGMRTLDAAFLPPRVLIGAGVRVKAIGMVIDFFAGVPGSSVVLRDSSLYRYAALPVDQSVPLLMSYGRPRAFPGAQRVRVIRPGGCTPAARADMVLDDLALRAEAAGPDAAAGAPLEYDIHCVNLTRECSRTPPPECLKSATPDYCLTALNAAYDLEAHGAGSQGALSAAAATPSATAAGGLPAGATACVAVAAAAGAALLIGGAAALAARGRLGRWRLEGKPAADAV